MLQVNNLSVSFAGYTLFQDTNFTLKGKDRIGFIGKNGVGKSTILKILSGKKEIEYTGSISFLESVSVGYLPQEFSNESSLPIKEEILQTYQDVTKIEKELAILEEEVSQNENYTSEKYSRQIERLTELNEILSDIKGSKKEGETEKLLKMLGFSEEEFMKPYNEFSGGWKMRVEIAKLLLQRPKLLLLDEPTNHLDIESLIWFEEYIKKYSGAFIIISHDKTFLDNVTTRTIELTPKKAYCYDVPYSRYLEVRRLQREQDEKVFKNQQKFVKQQEEFITRFRAKASKAKQVQSRVKQLEKFEFIDFEQEDKKRIRFHFPFTKPSGQILFQAENISFSYGEKNIISNLSLEVTRGERIAFVGQNGQGKSTLVKILNNQLQASGKMKSGHNIMAGYYAQVQEGTLNTEKTVYETLYDIAPPDWGDEPKLKSLLGAFLFRGKDFSKKVEVLSGGEKSRLALATLLLSPTNFLILDEPTNHLDIPSKNVLKQALLDFAGTLIVVSHDRDFLKGLTNKTLEFHGGTIIPHLGNIDTFLEKRKAHHFREYELQNTTKEKPLPKKQEDKKTKEVQQQLHKLQKQLNNTEKNIAKLEEEIKKSDVEIAKETPSEEPYNLLVKKREETAERLKKTLNRWEKIAEEIEILKG